MIRDEQREKTSLLFNGQRRTKILTYISQLVIAITTHNSNNLHIKAIPRFTKHSETSKPCRHVIKNVYVDRYTFVMSLSMALLKKVCECVCVLIYLLCEMRGDGVKEGGQIKKLKGTLFVLLCCVVLCVCVWVKKRVRREKKFCICF